MIEASVTAHRDWVVSPGEVLGEALEERGMTQAELARRMGRPTKTINEIVNAKAAVTPETAIQLERALGISAAFWNGMEKRYRESLADLRSQEELKRYVTWVRQFPVKQMIESDLLPNETGSRLVASLLRYFGVSSPTGWDKFWVHGGIDFRLASAGEPDLPALAAWVRWGEIEAEKVTAGPFDAAAFRQVLVKARDSTRSGLFDLTVSTLREDCAKAGVVVVLLPEFRGARTSGAARWLSADRALIQLSARYKTADQFWFSFFHEAGHLLNENRRSDVVEEALEIDEHDSPSERQADAYARSLLIPQSSYEEFVSRQDFSEDSIQQFAATQRLDPGIVLGRLQRDGHVPRRQLNYLKRRIDLVLA